MTDDHDLRSRLERLASSAGDPPEHGLDRVAARRHRRLHRRRGAVATATVLAVLAAALSLISGGDREPDTVAARNEAGVVGDAPVEVPRLVEVLCEPMGIVVPVGSVRAQSDGLHVRVINRLGGPTYVTVESNHWNSGEIPVNGPSKEFVQPIPPGQLEIGCQINGAYQARRVDLVDPQRYFTEPELACDESEELTQHNLPVEPSTSSIVAAVLQGLGDQMKDTDIVAAVKGYQSQILNEYTDEPQAAVWRGHDMVAFVYLRGADGSASAPYTSISLVEACPDALTAPTTTTSSTPPAGAPTT